jgi:hypothetical protein
MYRAVSDDPAPRPSVAAAHKVGLVLRSRESILAVSVVAASLIVGSVFAAGAIARRREPRSAAAPVVAPMAPVADTAPRAELPHATTGNDADLDTLDTAAPAGRGVDSAGARAVILGAHPAHLDSAARVPTLVVLRFDHATRRLDQGDSVRVWANVLNAGGRSVPGATVQVSSSDPVRLLVQGSGRNRFLIARGAGGPPVTVMARSGELADTASFSIDPRRTSANGDNGGAGARRSSSSHCPPRRAPRR